MQDESGPIASVRLALNTFLHQRGSPVVCFSRAPRSEGVVVASRVADRVGITRSVIASALRKLEMQVSSSPVRWE